MRTPKTEAAMKLADRVGRLLTGHPVPTVGAALCEALSRWLATQPQEFEAALLDNHIQTTKELTKVNRAILKKRTLH